MALNKIVLLHSLIFSFGGIPLLYYGNGIATFNDYSYLDSPDKANDSRWIHRPKIDWERAELRKKPGTVENTVFTALKKMIAIRKETTAFADFNNRQLVETDNPHVFVFIRFDHNRPSERVLVICNFSEQPQRIDMDKLSAAGFSIFGQVSDLYSGKSPTQFDRQLVIRPCGFYWLSEF